MVNIDTNEVSGVDFAATGLDGWIVMKAANGEEVVTKREFSDEQRQKLADSGAAMEGGGFPIVNTSDLKNAVRAIGRASNPDAAKAHIIKRARALGATDLLPDDWTVSKSGGNATVEEILAQAEELAKSHNSLMDALDNATYLEDAPEPVRKAVDILTDYLDTEYERERVTTSPELIQVLKTLSEQIMELKKETNSGGATKDEPDSGSDEEPDEEEEDKAGATKDLPSEGKTEEGPQGSGGTTKDQPDKGKPTAAPAAKAKSKKVEKAMTAAEAASTPHKYLDDGDGSCKVCGKSMSSGMHTKNFSKAAITYGTGSNSATTGGNYSFTFTSSDGQVWTSTGTSTGSSTVNSTGGATAVRKEGGVPEINRDALTDDVRAHVEMLETELTKSQEKLAKAKAKLKVKTDTEDGAGQGDNSDDEEKEMAKAMLKSLPEPMRKRWEKLEKSAHESREELKKERDERDLREAVAKSREWTHLPGLRAEEFAPSLVALRKSAPDQATVIEDLFSRASAAVKESALLKEIGSGHYDMGGDAMSKLETLARDSMTKAASPVTYEQAFAAVIKTPEGRQLYEEYNRERKEAGIK